MIPPSLQPFNSASKAASPPLLTGDANETSVPPSDPFRADFTQTTSALELPFQKRDGIATRRSKRVIFSAAADIVLLKSVACAIVQVLHGVVKELYLRRPT